MNNNNSLTLIYKVTPTSVTSSTVSSSGTWFNIGITLSPELSNNSVNYLMCLFVNGNKIAANINYDPTIATTSVPVLNNNSSSNLLVIDYAYVKIFNSALSDGILLRKNNNIEFDMNLDSYLSYYDFRFFITSDFYESILNNILVSGNNNLSLSQGTLLPSTIPNCGEKTSYDISSNSCVAKKYLNFVNQNSFNLNYGRDVTTSEFSFQIWFNVQYTGTPALSTFISNTFPLSTPSTSMNINFVSGKVAIILGTNTDNTANLISSMSWNYIGFTVYSNKFKYYRLFMSNNTQDIFSTIAFTNFSLVYYKFNLRK